jgi:hypothetical protein
MLVLERENGRPAMTRQGTRDFREIVRDHKSWPIFGLMGFSLTMIFVSPMLKAGLSALIGF